jgi:D-alanyl-D-alanine carboxypeptidase
MLNRRLLAQILTAFLTLTLVFVFHQTKPFRAKVTANRLGNRLAVVSISNRDSLNQKFQQILDNQVAQGVPGVTMYITTGDGWTWSGASGFSNLQEHIPMKASDRFRIMSATKTFVATVVLQLAQEGKLGDKGLDNTIGKLLPEAIANRIPNHDQITVRHLLNHRSGLFNYTDNERYEQETFSEGTLDNVIDWAFGQGSKPPSFAPGKRFDYCDTNAIVAELIVQHLTGHPLAAEIRDRILTPLGLKNTYMERVEAGAVVSSGFVHGYVEETNKHEQSLVGLLTKYFTPSSPVIKDVTDSGDVVGTGDGGLISNAEDLALFAKELLGKRTLLNAKVFNQMVHFNDHVGLGVFEEDVSFGRIWGHSGSWHGYTAQMYFLPDKNVAAAALGNGTNANPGRMLQEALSFLF